MCSGRTYLAKLKLSITNLLVVHNLTLWCWLLSWMAAMLYLVTFSQKVNRSVLFDLEQFVLFQNLIKIYNWLWNKNTSVLKHWNRNIYFIGDDEVITMYSFFFRYLCNTRIDKFIKISQSCGNCWLEIKTMIS